MSVLLKDRLCLITGGGGGLGAALSLGCAREGARVIVADVDLARAQQVADAVAQAGGQAWAESLDVTDRAATQAWAEDVRQRIGAIDVLINNAGVSTRCGFEDPRQPEEWDRVLSINLDGVFNVTRAMLGALKATRGCIVNLASIVSSVSGNSSAAYIASKGAVRSLTQAMARDFAVHGIRVNAVAPGVVMTDLVKPQLAEPGGLDWFMRRAPMARAAEPEELVGPVVFLASAMASFVHGAILPVDGGFLSA